MARLGYVEDLSYSRPGIPDQQRCIIFVAETRDARRLELEHRPPGAPRGISGPGAKISFGSFGQWCPKIT